ncbi:uncharacterized protein FIBRA_08427 [Fibroporia radiculosa]|uniref:NAD(P)-binding protein n=1 Tax=Fibroporia radiculosa TaxID=599839 RepID=J4GWS5_9APHY|nr:uncharacterized protein FIBRA_08427 [Fibroporia radiculosa]CCM06185.1 predicted protein [Fibroporia radiculosa]
MRQLQNFSAVFSQMFPGKPKFSTEEIPDLSGRVVIVTGGNVGIGKETIKVLLEHNAKVYMATRSEERANVAIKELKQLTKKEAIFLKLDLSSLVSVREAARAFLQQENKLHILFNNAGVMWCPHEMISADGYDMQFATNVMGHYYFTKLLMPALLAGRDTSPDRHTRVITTSSSGAYMATLNFDSLKDGPKRKKVTTETLYYQSKFANVVVSRQFAKRFGEQGVISISVNPGTVDTELLRHTSPRSRSFMRATFLMPAPWGALTQLWGGTMPEALKANGEFLIPWAKVGKCRQEAYDDELGSKLWKWLEEQVRPYQG